MLRILPLVVLAAAVTLPSFSQEKPAPQNPAPAAGTPATDAQLVDEYLATWMIVGNKNEITLAELAQKQATDPAVKQFAQKLVESHRQFVQKLQPFAAGTGDSAGQADGASQPKSAQPAAFAGSKDGFDHTGLVEELGAQCLQTARKELEQKKGADFDLCYMTMEIGSHLHANDMLVVFQKHASAPLKAAFSEEQRMGAAHLAEAKAYVQKAGAKGAPAEDKAGK